MNYVWAKYGLLWPVAICLIMVMGCKTALSQDIPPPNPSININIITGYTVQFHFNEIEEYKNGIQNEGQSTFIRIGSVYDWTLQFKADQAMFYGNGDPSNQMELNNVGVIVVNTGTNQDDGSNIINYARNVPLALDDDDVTLMTRGTQTNKGYGIKNAFTLNWEMGTMRGNMNNISMIEQMLNADTYILNIILTVTVAQ